MFWEAPVSESIGNCIGRSNQTLVLLQLPCGSYEQMEYWPTNFNDFYSALVLLWDIMIVNNWNVFLDVFTRRSGTEFAKVYFIVWWLLSNILLLNLMTSLTIETLMLRISLDKESKLMSANPSQATAAMDSNLDFLEPHHGNEGLFGNVEMFTILKFFNTTIHCSFGLNF